MHLKLLESFLQMHISSRSYLLFRSRAWEYQSCALAIKHPFLLTTSIKLSVAGIIAKLTFNIIELSRLHASLD